MMLLFFCYDEFQFDLLPGRMDTTNFSEGATRLQTHISSTNDPGQTM